MRFVRERFGDDGCREVVAELPPEDQAILTAGVLPHEWVRFALWVRLMTAIDHRFGKGDLAMCREMGRFSARVNLPTLYRIFYQLGSTRYIMRRAARLWDVHYDSGRLVVDEGGPGLVTLRIEGFDTPHRAHCLSVLGWGEQSVEMSGGANPVGDELACRTQGALVCELRLRWEER